MRRGQDFQIDVVALGVAQHYPRRKIGGAGAGADVGQNVADLNIVAAEAAAGGEPALDVGHIVVVPQPAGGGLGQLHGHPAALDVEEGVSQLLCADEHIVCHRVAAKQGLAVVGRFGLGVRPVVIGFGGPDQPLDGLKVGVLCTGGIGEGLPVGVVQEQKLHRLCHREYFDAAVVVEVALGQVAPDVGRPLLVGEVGRKVHQLAHLVHRIGGVRVGHEDVGHLLCAHLALCRGHHLCLKVIDIALTAVFHGDVLFLADSRIELFDQSVEAFQLVAVVVRPDGQLHRLDICRSAALLSPAACEAEHQRCSCCECSQSVHPVSFHHLRSLHHAAVFLSKDTFIIPLPGRACKHFSIKSAILQHPSPRFLFHKKAGQARAAQSYQLLAKAQVCPAFGSSLTACSAGDPERYP